MPDAMSMEQIVDGVAGGAVTERETAIALHDYVRDRIKFGFNRYFDAGTPEQIAVCGTGHCNPKSRLLAALFRQVGLESHLHFVVIPKTILRGAIPGSRYWMIPVELSHSFVEVRVGGAWCAIDSHIVDTPLLQAALARLRREGGTMGYGVRIDSTNLWDGQSNAFSQYDPALVAEDHGRVDDPMAYFRSPRYRNHVMGLRFNTMFRLMGDVGVAGMNRHLDKLRTAEVRQSGEVSPRSAAVSGKGRNL
jgi:transglutaminase-like putative cysteine protease